MWGIGDRFQVGMGGDSSFIHGSGVNQVSYPLGTTSGEANGASVWTDSAEMPSAWSFACTSLYIFTVFG